MKIFSADELSTYVVCPEAWRLKFLENKIDKRDERAEKGAELKREWVEKQDLSHQLKSYAKIAYLLLLILTVIVFIFDQKLFLEKIANKKLIKLVDAGSVPVEIVALMLILGLLIFMWDFFDRHSKTINRSQGLNEKSEILSVKGSDYLESKQFESKELGLISKPDALIKEKKTLIPVDINTLSNKVRDRHIIRMIAHLRLIEENEGTRPPYGLIILGKEKIQHKIENVAEKQIWLEALLAEMRSIENGIPAMASPLKAKCEHCDVKEFCKFRV